MDTSAPRPRGSALAIACALALPVATAAAQDSSSITSVSRPMAVADRKQVVSIQPIISLLGVISLDYERVVRGGFTLGVGGSFWNAKTLGLDFGDVLRAEYASGELKGRFYPSGRPFHGFSVGLTAGGSRVAYRIDLGEAGTTGTVVAHGVKVGSEIDYNWIVGRKRRVAFAVGVGGKRIFYEDPVPGVQKRLADSYPTSRIAVGYAF